MPWACTGFTPVGERGAPGAARATQADWLRSRALASPLATLERFSVHMAQHMLLGMAGPLLLSLSAPVTLALRTLPRRPRRTLVELLHAPALAWIAHPLSATALFVGGLAALYFMPLYRRTLHHPLLHELVHLHFLLSGCLFAWVFVGVDPVPRLGSMRLRIALLVVALGSHAVMAKLLYAGVGSIPVTSLRELHQGAQIMFYGGDALDLALLLAFFSQWYAAGGRRLERERRRARLTA